MQTSLWLLNYSPIQTFIKRASLKPQHMPKNKAKCPSEDKGWHPHKVYCQILLSCEPSFTPNNAQRKYIFSAGCLTVLICHSIALAACCSALGSLSTMGLSERSCCKWLPAGVEETPLFLVCSQDGLEYVAGCKSNTGNKRRVELMSWTGYFD